MSEAIWTPQQPRATGCLPRKSKPGTVCSLAKDKLEVIPRAEWDSILAGLPNGCIDFSDRIGEFYDQDGYGSCAMESWHKAVETILRLIHGADVIVPKFNPWFAYGIAVNWRGGPRVGTSIDENFTLLQKIGCCPEDIWGRGMGPNKKPSAEAYAAAEKYKPLEGLDCENVDEVGTALIKTRPVVVGWNGHSELLVGLKPGGIVKVCGSYGSDYYNGSGFHEKRVSDINFGYGAIALQTAVDLGLSS